MKIIINGYYGFDNIGDEAVLLGLITQIRATDNEVDIVVMSQNSLKTAVAYDVTSIHRTDRKELENHLKNADLFISGGGSLIQDVTSWRSPLYYLYIIHLALKYKVKTVIACQGIGPLRHPIIQKLTKLVLDKLPYISLRDEDSLELLEEIGVNRPEIEVAGDPAITLDIVPSERIDTWWSENIPQETKIMGLTLRPVTNMPNEKFMPLIDSVNDWGNVHNGRILFIPFFYDIDLPFSRDLAKELNVSDPIFLDIPDITPLEMIYLISKIDHLIAIRLHAIIFAAMTETVVTGISYDPKVRSFCDIMDISCTELDSISDKKLLDFAINNAGTANKELLNELRTKTVNVIKKIIAPIT
jgi:polysaccharide pyruvyl transferase CsaB